MRDGHARAVVPQGTAGAQLMDARELDALCRAMPGATHDRPFSPDVDVWRIAGKLFALAPTDAVSVNLKVEPALGAALREQYPASIRPGYHMNKRHWITVQLDGSLPDGMVADLVEDSYDLVRSKLPARIRRELGDTGQ